MSDRAYTRFSIPLSVLADPAKTEVVRSTFGIPLSEFQRVMLSDPAPDEAAGYEGTTIRQVDGRTCLVVEDPDGNYGGSQIEQALANAGVPYIQVNGAGDEYGSTSTVFDGTTSETIRLSHDLAPVIGIGVIDGRITLDQQEIRDFEHYRQIRQAVLLWPAVIAAVA